jgi:hypothetical protein
MASVAAFRDEALAVNERQEGRILQTQTEDPAESQPLSRLSLALRKLGVNLIKRANDSRKRAAFVYAMRSP